MKKFASKVVLTLAVSMLTYNLFSAPAMKMAVIDRVGLKIEQINGPAVDYTSSLPVSANSRKHLNTWNLISVDFNAGHKDLSKSGKGEGEIVNIAENRYWLDDVVITVKAVCESASEAAVDRHVLFTGTCKLWNVALDNKKHTVWFFLPPHLLDRYYVPKSVFSAAAQNRNNNFRGGNVKNKASLANHKLSKGNLLLEVVISCAGGTKVLAREYLNVKGGKRAEKQKEFDKLIGKVPNKYNFEGALLSKGQSPWAYYKFDQFDLEKVTAR